MPTAVVAAGARVYVELRIVSLSGRSFVQQTDLGRRRLPLFPLPVVLFPGALLPLHVFESRYRRMAAFCLEADRRFGLLYHDNDRYGQFVIDPGRVGCVAEIMKFQPLPDGRSLMLTRGIERFRISDGIESGSPYHEALVESDPDDDVDIPDLPERRSRTIHLFHKALTRLSDEGNVTAPPAVSEVEDVSYQIARSVRTEPAWQQRLLAARTEDVRLEQLDALLLTVISAGRGDG